MITIDGETFPSHKEYFDKYPYKKYVNKRINVEVLMEQYKKPCPDCGLRWHPATMSLDHTERDGYKTTTGKRRHPSQMLSYPPDLFLKEIEKCEAVCRNCHLIREMVRDGLTKSKKWRDFGEAALLPQEVLL